MNIKYTLFLLLSLFFSHGCILSSPDASRINENDPESPFFEPKLSELNSNVSPVEKRISLNWKNESRYNDGFFVEKKFSNNDSYKITDTVVVSTFSEALNSYNIDLKYRVTTFYLENGIPKKGMNLETDSLNFGRLTNIGHFTSNDSVFVQWFRRTAFDDQITVEYKPTNSSEWIVGKTVLQSEMASDFYRTNFTLPTGNYNIRINAFIINNKENLEKFFTSSIYTISLN